MALNRIGGTVAEERPSVAFDEAAPRVFLGKVRRSANQFQALSEVEFLQRVIDLANRTKDDAPLEAGPASHAEEHPQTETRRLNLSRARPAEIEEFPERLSFSWHAPMGEFVRETQRRVVRAMLEPIAADIEAERRKARKAPPTRLAAGGIAMVPVDEFANGSLQTKYIWMPYDLRALVQWARSRLLVKDRPYGDMLAKCAYEPCGNFFLSRPGLPRRGRPNVKYCPDRDCGDKAHKLGARERMAARRSGMSVEAYRSRWANRRKAK
jgi:hypothetical protein